MNPRVAGSALMLGFLAMELLRRGEAAKRVAPTATDRGTTALIVAAYAVAVAAIATRVLPVVALPLAVAWAGAIVGALGFVLRIWAMRVLGRFYTRTLVTVGDQTVVRDGPYRRIRHPGYTGSILVWVGAAMTSSNAIAIALVTGLFAIAYAHRIRSEEEMLLAALGEAYEEYRKGTWRLVPFVF